MTDVGYATLGIIPSAKGLAAQLEKQTKGDIQRVGKASGARFGDAFRSALLPVAAGAGALGFLNDIKNQAADAEQAVGGLQAVFGKYADEAQRASENAAQRLGLSRTEFQELLTLSGALLKNKGLEDFAAQSEKLLSIGADLAAQYGGPTRQAVEALNSALRGESDPIERYAISLNESAVNARLAASGQSKLTGAALEQAKTQARLALIIEQSADAQGAFARESDTAAGAAQRASAQWADMRRELGEKLLPAYSNFVSFLNQDALPALERTGGVASDLVGVVDDLPGPVKAAAGALVAFKAAQAVGITTAFASGVAATSSATASVRLRAMLAADAYRATATTATGAAAANGRLAASFAVVKAGAAGSGPAVAGFAKTAGSIAVLVGAFKTLDALAPDDRAVGRYVEKVEALAGPQISDQIKALNVELAKQKRIVDDAFGPTFNFLGSTVTPFEFGSEWKTADEKIRQIKDQIAELRHQQDLNGISQKQATTAVATYASQISNARSKVLALLDVENKRREGNRTRFRDQTALAQSLADATKEAREGARTLAANTQAGRDNRDALASLADQWSNSANSVKNAKGAYENFRAQFIDIAEKMGASETKAKRLADQLIQIPKHTPAKVSTPGMEKALADLKKLNEELRLARVGARIQIGIQGQRNRNELNDLRGTPGRGATTTAPRTTTHSSTYNFNGNIVANDPAALLREAQNRARRAAMEP